MGKNANLKIYKRLSLGLGATVVVLLVAVLLLWTSKVGAPESNQSIDTENPANIQEPGQEDSGYAQAFIGLTEKDAIDKAASDGYSYRIAARDGEQFPLTMDYNPKRINFTIENGIVTRATLG